MKKQATVYLGALLIGFISVLPTQADEAIINAQQLQAAIEAFGVSAKQAEQAASESINIIKEKDESSKSIVQQDMTIVSDDFFTLQPL